MRPLKIHIKVIRITIYFNITFFFFFSFEFHRFKPFVRYMWIENNRPVLFLFIYLWTKFSYKIGYKLQPYSISFFIEGEF